MLLPIPQGLLPVQMCSKLSDKNWVSNLSIHWMRVIPWEVWTYEKTLVKLKSWKRFNHELSAVTTAWEGFWGGGF